jgi:hypothetical protein
MSTCCRYRSEGCMRKTGAQSATALTVRGSKMEAHRTPVPSHTGVAIASSGTVWKGVEEAQVGPPLHVLGAQVDPVKSQIDSTQLSATTYISEASVYIQQALHHARAADTQTRGWRRKTGAQSLTTLTVQGSKWKRTARRAIATPGVAIASSGTVWKSRATQVGPPLHVLGCARSIPSSRRSIRAQLSATNTHKLGKRIHSAGVYTVLPMQIRGWHARQIARSLTAVDCTGIENGAARASAVTHFTPGVAIDSGTVWKGSRGGAGRSTIACDVGCLG